MSSFFSFVGFIVVLPFILGGLFILSMLGIAGVSKVIDVIVAPFTRKRKK